MSKEAMKLALEALKKEHENYRLYGDEDGSPEYIHEAIKALEEALAKQEQGESVAATDTQISFEAHAEDPLDWNDLNFKECWHEGFSAGFRAAETFHKIGVSQ